jgi:esterase/lipase
MGGALATILAAQSPTDALVLLAPYLRLSPHGRRIARFPRAIMMVRPYLHSRTETSILDAAARSRALGGGVSTPRLIHELAAVVSAAWSAAPLVQAPTLVIHSTRDPRIAVVDARTGFEHLGAAHKVLKWAEHSGHVLSADFDREWVGAEALAWLEAHTNRAGRRNDSAV